MSCAPELAPEPVGRATDTIRATRRAPSHSAAARTRSMIIALVSLTVLGLELACTRIFSAEFFYSFAFLMLSLAILGLGLGALTLRLFPLLGRKRLLSPTLVLAGVATLAGPPFVFCLGLNFAALLDSWGMIGRLLAAIALLALPYFFSGLALAALLRRARRDLPRLYMADLLGAGVGVVSAVVLMNTLGTPVTTVLIAVPALLAALLAARGLMRLVPLVPLAAACVLIPYAGRLLAAPREERAAIVYQHWDATAKIKVYQYDEQNRGINIDNAANSPVRAFDGDWDRPDRERFGFAIDVSNLIRRFDACTFLSLGAGGGGDVLQALQAGARDIHAVEVNPHINRMMQAGELAEFSGHIYADPRVHVVTEDARIYVRQHPHTFDLIYSLSSNSFSALASGSFALAENYLFTTEAFGDYWEALTDGGFMMMEHQYYTPRLVPALLDALTRAGVTEPTAHFAAYDLPRMHRQMLLISKRPLTDEIRESAFGALAPENYADIHLLYPAPENLQDNLINRIVQQGWRAAASSAPVNISPCTDDRPFVGQMGRWANFHWQKPAKLSGFDVMGFPISQVIIVVLLIITVVLILPLNLLPYLFRGPRLRAAPWLYFFTIGAAFMSVEVVLIQKYALFVGPSASSLATVLLTLLVAAGMGSRWSGRFSTPVAFGGLVGCLLLETFVYPRVTSALIGLSPGARIALAALLIAPLGFFMGMPFPKGALRVGTLVDWGFAIGGTASVFGATAILLVAMTFGFRAALLTGAALYTLAWVLSGAPLEPRATAIALAVGTLSRILIRMTREPIDPNDLVLPPFAAWEPGWLLLTAGENRPGAFNSMTVSWGAFGVIWHRPLAIVVVRPQRYTREFLERCPTFSLCAFGEAHRPALNVLGTVSGRGTDKMTECGLTPIALTRIDCPGFAEAKLILECRKMYFDDLDPAHFLADFIAPHYSGDFHRMYFGEIVAASGTDEYRRPR